MDQSTRNQWINHPVFTGFIGNLLSGLVLLIVAAVFTGRPLSLSFTWLRSLLLTSVPLWVTLLMVAASTPLSVLYLRARAAKRSFAGESSVTSAPNLSIPGPLAAKEPSPAPLESSALMAKPVSPLYVPAKTLDAREITISSPDDFSLRLRTVNRAGFHGVEAVVENYRDTSIHQIRLLVSTFRSFDARLGRFREPAVSGQDFQRPDTIRASCSGAPILLLWKEPQFPSLITGDQNIRRQLLWPNLDQSDVERWQLSVRLSAMDTVKNNFGHFQPLQELTTDLIVRWIRATEEVQLEVPGGSM